MNAPAFKIHGLPLMDAIRGLVEYRYNLCHSSQDLPGVVPVLEAMSDTLRRFQVLVGMPSSKESDAFAYYELIRPTQEQQSTWEGKFVQAAEGTQDIVDGIIHSAVLLIRLTWISADLRERVQNRESVSSRDFPFHWPVLALPFGGLEVFARNNLPTQVEWLARWTAHIINKRILIQPNEFDRYRGSFHRRKTILPLTLSPRYHEALKALIRGEDPQPEVHVMMARGLNDLWPEIEKIRNLADLHEWFSRMELRIDPQDMSQAFDVPAEQISPIQETAYSFMALAYSRTYRRAESSEIWSQAVEYDQFPQWEKNEFKKQIASQGPEFIAVLDGIYWEERFDPETGDNGDAKAALLLVIEHHPSPEMKRLARACLRKYEPENPLSHEATLEILARLPRAEDPEEAMRSIGQALEQERFDEVECFAVALLPRSSAELTLESLSGLLNHPHPYLCNFAYINLRINDRSDLLVTHWRTIQREKTLGILKGTDRTKRLLFHLFVAAQAGAAGDDEAREIVETMSRNGDTTEIKRWATQALAGTKLQ